MLPSYLKKLEKQLQKQQHILKAKRRKEIIIRAEINKIENRKTIQKMNETKKLFWESVKLINFQKDKEKREKTQFTNTGTERVDSTTECAYIKKIREYHEQLCTESFDNVEEMDQFQEKHKLPQLIQYEINNLNNL